MSGEGEGSRAAAGKDAVGETPAPPPTASARVKLLVNGLEREAAAGTTVAELLAAEGEPIGLVIVEIDGLFIPPGSYGSRLLGEGDRVEIILPAFGG